MNSDTHGRKLDVIKRHVQKKSTVYIASVTGIPESKLRNIMEQANISKESCKSETKLTATRTTQMRALIIKKFGMTLVHWLEHKYQRPIPLSAMKIEA
jgi:hypothetical protein